MTTTSTTHEIHLTPGDVRTLRRSFDLSLRAANKSPRTTQSYLETLDQFVRWIVEQGIPTTFAALRREHIELWLLTLRDAGRAPATIRIRYAGLRQFFGFAVEEGEITESPMRNVRAPSVPEQPVAVLTVDQVRALLATCKSRDSDDVRDTAIITLLYDTGIRRAELL